MATSREWAQVIAKAWIDEEFKSLLEKDPSTALKQLDIETDGVFPFQEKPKDLKEDALEVIYSQYIAKDPKVSATGVVDLFFSLKSEGKKQSYLLAE